MKIGIISMQRVPNYGSFLQAYGLKNLLESLGHTVVFMDYKPGAPAVPYSRISRAKYRLLNAGAVRYAQDSIRHSVLHRKSFVYQYRLQYLRDLGIGYRRRSKTAVDVAVIGSDEVFNCLQSGFNVGFSPMLFGQGLKAKKVISYAASFGYTDLPGLKKYGLDGPVSGYLKTFADISVRDENSKRIVEALTGKSPEVNLDPVLVSAYDIPPVKIPYTDYVILYTYKSREYSQADKASILDFCRKNKKTLISVGNAQHWVEHRVEASPLELLSYIQHADFIITDTFHGTVFSIKYHKPFAVLIRENNKQKLGDLLNRLHKTERAVDSFSDLQRICSEPMDYAKTDAVIEAEKKHTLLYLRRNLI